MRNDFIGTQVFAVVMCGFGWFVAPLPWPVIGLIWAHMLIWMVVLDLVKLAVYRRVAAQDHQAMRPASAAGRA